MRENSLSMTRDQITIGVTLRVIGPRWDRPIGTLARVTDTGIHFVGKEWWFTVEWLTSPRKRSPHSLRIGEEELDTFEIVTGPIVIDLPTTPTKQRLASEPLLPQMLLPFATEADDG